MNFFKILFFSVAVLSCIALISGQGYRCNTGSTSLFCYPIDPKRTVQAQMFSFSPGKDDKTTPPSVLSYKGIPKCSTKYRTLDGSCTNDSQPEAGAARTAQFSFIPGSSSVTPNGENRPSPRLVSNLISEQGDVDIPNRRGLTLFFVFFGQFLDHDLVMTPLNMAEPFNIPVPRGDSIFENLTSSNSHGRLAYRDGSGTSSSSELIFFRSIRARSSVQHHGQERPVNVLSSPIDLSAVYGVEQERFERLHVKGSCKMLTKGNRPFLPTNRFRIENEPSNSRRFFIAGDLRANENPILTSIHTLFILEHNKLCDDLEKDFRKESPIKLFSLARKLNIFQMQKIVYEEFLPAITGRKLRPGNFNPKVNPSVSDIFSTAAFRLGHTMVGDTIPTGRRFRPVITARDMFFIDSSRFQNFSFPSRYLFAATNTLAQEVDVKVVDALRNFLFSNVDEVAGIDLIALNLQRGRDHALPSYNTVRKIFGLSIQRRFSDVSSSLNLQSRLKNTYGKVDNMDLWIALLAEDHVPGASMGETMLRIWEAEFKRLAEGDRFFYTRPNLFDRKFKKTFTRFADISKSKSLMRDILIRHAGHPSVRPNSVFRLK